MWCAMHTCISTQLHVHVYMNNKCRGLYVHVYYTSKVSENVSSKSVPSYESSDSRLAPTDGWSCFKSDRSVGLEGQEMLKLAHEHI